MQVHRILGGMGPVGFYSRETGWGQTHIMNIIQETEGEKEEEEEEIEGEEEQEGE